MATCRFCGRTMKYTGRKDWAGKIYKCTNKNCLI
jgi:hypothetical protein